MKLSLQDYLQGDGEPTALVGTPMSVGLETLIETVSGLESCHREMDRSRKTLLQLTQLQALANRQDYTKIDGQSLASLESVYSIITEQAGCENIVLPALESNAEGMAGARLVASQESIQAGIRRAVEYVLNTIRRLGMLFVRLLEQISPHLRILRTELYRLRQAANGISGTPTPQGSLVLGRGAGLFSTELAAPKTGAMVVRGLTEFGAQYSVVAKSVYDNNLKLVKEFSRLLDNPPKGPDIEQWVGNVTQLLRQYNPSNFGNQFKAPQRVSDPRWPTGSAVAATPVVGQRSLIIIRVEPTSDDLSAQLQAATSSGLAFTRMNPGALKDYSKGQLPVMSYQEILESVKLLEALLNIVDGQIIGGRRTAVKEVCRSLAAAAERTGRSAEAEGGLMAQAINAAGAVTGWLANPYIAMTSHAISVISAHTRLIRQHLKAYEPGAIV